MLKQESFKKEGQTKAVLWIIIFVLLFIRIFYCQRLTEIQELKSEISVLNERLALGILPKWNLQNFVILDMEATGYAPLDPSAKKGMCYSGDRTKTASGATVVPNLTVATGKHIPFGTWLWIEGLGWRIVEDRGGKIGKEHIDICFKTQKEALAWGRKKVRVVVPVTTNKGGQD